MTSLNVRNFDTPDEIRTPDKTRVEILNIGGAKVGRFTFQPGWRWSECVQPVVGGEQCQVHHVGLVGAGRLHVVHQDGSEGEAGPGDVYVIEAGHDAWVVGDEAFVGYEFDQSSAETYATR